MKTKFLIPFVLCVSGILFVLTSFSSPEDYVAVSHDYEPVFMQRAALDKSVFFAPAQNLQQIGKIYVKDHFIFVNEKYKGIHVIDNSNPKTPVPVGFINAPGCIDMAVKGHILYLDNAIDLVVFNLNTKVVTERIKNAFLEPRCPDGVSTIPQRPANFILVEWRAKK